MDIKIENKDIKTDGNGDVVMIEGLDEIIQQIEINLSVKRGSFIYDRNMGVELTEENLLGENGEKLLCAIIYEGLINQPDIDVEVRCIEKRNEKIYAGIIVGNKIETREKEVIVYE